MFSQTLDRPLWALQLSYDIWHSKPVPLKPKSVDEEEHIRSCNAFLLVLLGKIQRIKAKVAAKMRSKRIFYTQLKTC
jgi:hypothetical protein